jgi:hypothetical protein
VADYSVSMTDQISGSLLQDVDLKGLDNMKLNLGGGTTSTLAGGAKIDSDATVRLEPVTTTSTVNLEPVAVDSCVRLELGALPATDVHTPYQQRWALEILGVELVALKVSGETTTSVRPARRTGTVLDIERHSAGHRDCGCDGHAHTTQPYIVSID